MSIFDSSGRVLGSARIGHFLLSMLDRFEEVAANAARVSRSPNPRYWADALLLAALVRLGRKEEAETAKAVLLERKPDFTIKDLQLPVKEVGRRLYQHCAKQGCRSDLFWPRLMRYLSAILYITIRLFPESDIQSMSPRTSTPSGVLNLPGPFPGLPVPSTSRSFPSGAMNLTV